MDELLESVLEEITPSKEEREREKKLIEDLNVKLSSFGVKPVLVGSIAKDTDLSQAKDVDLFILFNPDVSREDLEKKGLEIGRRVFSDLGASYEIDYAEHPYVKGVYGGYDIEIVPCYASEKPRTAVDRTPFHTQYVKRKIREDPKLSGEIRLMKQFMKGIGVYGAEAKVEGFSGYMTELLVIYFGSFKRALGGISQWGFEEVIDPEGLWEDKKSLKFFFPKAPLIVVDAIDENRNAAAAVSVQRLSEFIYAAGEFLRSPSEAFFFPDDKHPPSQDDLKARLYARGSESLMLEVDHRKVNVNTLYSQLRRTEQALKKAVESYGFSVLKSGFWTDEINRSYLVFEFEVWQLSKVMRREGPRIDKNLVHQRRFLEKYASQNPYIHEDRWVVESLRPFTQVDDAMKYLSEKREGFGKNLREDSSIQLFKKEKILEGKPDGFLCFMGSFLTPL